MKNVIILLLAILCNVCISSVAHAHSYIESSTPSSDAIITTDVTKILCAYKAGTLLLTVIGIAILFLAIRKK